MSLLVFSSANKIAHGVIKRLYTSGAYEKIVAADLYPNYWAHQRFIDFKEQLKSVNSNTKLHDIQISDKSDLASAIKIASQVVYITHDYYSLVPSKLNLIKTTAEFCKKYNTQRLVALTPVEHDHYNEENPYNVVAQSEKAAFEILPTLTHLKPDITFGENSTVVNNLVYALVNHYNIYQNFSSAKARPIHADDVAEIVEQALNDNSLSGNSYSLEGPDAITLNDLFKKLEDHAGVHGRVNHCWYEKIIPPTSVNLISEKIYSTCYINRNAFLKQYKSIEGLKPFPSSGKLRTIEETYSKAVNYGKYVNSEFEIEKNVKDFLY